MLYFENIIGISELIYFIFMTLSKVTGTNCFPCPSF
jgi:hypothetical protein